MIWEYPSPLSTQKIPGVAFFIDRMRAKNEAGLSGPGHLDALHAAGRPTTASTPPPVSPSLGPREQKPVESGLTRPRRQTHQTSDRSHDNWGLEFCVELLMH